MKNAKRIRVTCPECEILYRLPDERLLAIARCGRCYGSVVAERGVGPIEAVDGGLPQAAAV